MNSLEIFDGVAVYMNDLVHGKSQEEHDEHLRHVLERIEQAGRKLNKNIFIF